MQDKKTKIVTIGGGTGSFTLLTELKELPNVEVTAVVAMSDSGGSTGRLRVDMGVLPAGDVRQALVALSRSPDILRELFTYRYDAGTISGHTFGNLFLATLEKISGSLEEAIKRAGKLLDVKGYIYPVTLTDHHLVAMMPNGEEVHGEGVIDGRYIAGYTSIMLTNSPVLNPNVARAIAEADIVIIAPGNFYCSIVANLLVPGLSGALRESKARKVLVANLLTKQGHTDCFDVAKFLTELRQLADFMPSTVLYNTQYSVTPSLEELYKSEEGELVKLGDVSSFEQAQEQEDEVEFIGANLVARGPLATKSKADTFDKLSVDTVKRSLLRHDASKVLQLLGL